MKFKAKLKHTKQEYEEDGDFYPEEQLDKEGYITGFYVETDSGQAYIVGPLIEVDNFYDYTILEYWCPVIKETVEVVKDEI